MQMCQIWSNDDRVFNNLSDIFIELLSESDKKNRQYKQYVYIPPILNKNFDLLSYAW